MKIKIKTFSELNKILSKKLPKGTVIECESGVYKEPVFTVKLAPDKKKIKE